jgi:hypothetical protein
MPSQALVFLMGLHKIKNCIKIQVNAESLASVDALIATETEGDFHG